MRSILILIAAVGMVGCGDQTNPKRRTNTTSVRIMLDGSVHKIEGLAWTVDAERPVESMTIEDHANLTLCFPSGRKYATFSKVTYLNQKEGVVSLVKVAPLRKTMGFAEALVEVRSLMDEIGIEDEQFKSRWRKHMKNPPRWADMTSVTFGCQIDKQIGLFVAIRPASENDRWFLCYEFSVNRFYE